MSRVRFVVAALAAAVSLVPSAVGSGTGGIVISQVFGGGGNAGAPYANDYVELFNRGTTAVDIGGWTLQYATAAGTSWQTVPLVGTVPAGGRYLVQLAGGTEGAALPRPDATATTNVSSTSGKVAVVRSTTPLTCGAAAGSCASAAALEDLVGYGTAADHEGAGAAPALTSTTAALRAGGGCTDTDVNSADFAAGAPSPRNSSAAAEPCTATPAPGPTASASSSVDLEIQPVLSLALERSALDFGATTSGATPAPLSQRVTVVSNHPAGYALSVQRTRFAPADLPLALRATAPAGGTLAAAFAGGALVPIAIGPATATIGTTAALSAPEGDAWAASLGFAGPLPSVAPGRYSATVTFTVIGR